MESITLFLFVLSLFLSICTPVYSDEHIGNGDMLEEEWPIQNGDEENEEQNKDKVDENHNGYIFHNTERTSMELRNEHNVTAHDRDMMYPLTDNQMRILSDLCNAAFVNENSRMNRTDALNSCFKIKMSIHERNVRFLKSKQCFLGVLQNGTGYENITADDCLAHVDEYLWDYGQLS